MTDPEWWERFFVEPWSKIQSGGYPVERTATECDLIQSALELTPGARVLDVPCGIGRHCVELARRGFGLTGIDFNPTHVEQARAAARAGQVAARFEVADMRDFALPDRFDAAFCYFGSFGYFSDADNERFVRAVAASLSPGGRFLIEGHLLETVLPIYRERDWFWAGSADHGVRVLEERRWDLETGRIEGTWTTIDEDGARSTASSIRIYGYRELRDMLVRAGFASVRILDGLTGQSFQLGARRALVVARIR